MDNRNLPPRPAQGALGAVSCQFGANASGDVVVTLNDSVSITTEGATADRTQEMGAPPRDLKSPQRKSSARTRRTSFQSTHGKFRCHTPG